MPADSISQFSQFGLGGAVIFALFYFLKGFLGELKSMNETHDRRIETMAKTHYEAIEAMNRMHNDRHDARNDLHAKERREWAELFKDNTAVLRTLAERKCSSFIAMEKKQNV